MYAYISGNITLSSPTELVLENQGIGYLVKISLYTYTHLREAQSARLYIYEHIREDTHDLYGFFTEEEKSVFMELIKVSGISAHSARLMLSARNPQELVQIITEKDAKRLESIKGIGKKTAERIIIELKDRLAKTALCTALPANTGASNMEEDALQALLALGIARGQAEGALRKLRTLHKEAIPSLEAYIKEALQYV